MTSGDTYSQLVALLDQHGARYRLIHHVPEGRTDIVIPELALVVDPSLLENDEIYFNAARLDRSMVLNTSDYMTLAKPRLARIASGPGAAPGGAPGSQGPLDATRADRR